MRSALTILALSIALCQARKEAPKPKCLYESCPPLPADKLNVHLICHSHDDAGWLKTVDQYYWGTNNSIAPGAVQYVLDTVVRNLQHDPHKRFTFVEMSYFWRWWNNQHDYMRHSAKKLVDNGQLEFVHGGWVSNDEATPHYSAIIDQMTFGLRKLNETFGVCGRPRIGWQIDTFGHSRENAALYALMGLDGMFFARLHSNDRDKRWKDKEMEMIWRGSDDLGSKADVFTSAFYKDYMPPPGFCFDEDCGDDAIVDSDLYADSKVKNVDAKVDQFLEYVANQSKVYKTNNILLTMGGDFQYRNADRWYSNLDKLIKYVNERQDTGSNVNVFYSTPSCYLKALNDTQTKWPVKTDDFFPYATDDHSYWTGYYSSRPALKRFVREANGVLQVCKKMDALAQLTPMDLAIIDIAKEAVAIVQHHDGVSGTAQQHVTNDYAARLSRGLDECEKVFNDATNPDESMEVGDETWIKFCPLLNTSRCDVTENNDKFTITAFNGLSRNQTQFLRVPVSAGTSTTFNIEGPNGPIKGVVIENMPVSVGISQSQSQLVFPATLPPLGFATFKVSKVKDESIQFSPSESSEETDSEESDDSDMQVVSNKHFGLKFRNGLLHSILQNGGETKINQSFYWYSPHLFDNDTKQASGAYIFRPNSTEAYPIATGDKIKYKLITNDYVKEMRQTFAPWLTQVIRIYFDRYDVEFEWTVGPVPIDEKTKVGKEIISRFEIPDLHNNGVFYTDANGRQIIKRTRNFQPTYTYSNTEPIAGNYYPVTSMIFIKDDINQLTVLTDRAQGGSSVKDGSLELMVHRRLLQDDNFGVIEPLNEPGADGKGLIVRGRHWVTLAPVQNGPKVNRPLAAELFLRPILLFNAGVTADPPRSWGVKSSLPPNVNVLTVEQWHKGTVLVRLEHIFQTGEDPILSAPVVVDLSTMFNPAFTVVNATELTLSANRLVGDMDETEFKAETNSVRILYGLEGANKLKRHKSRRNSLLIKLNPMEIRTFRCDITRTTPGESS